MNGVILGFEIAAGIGLFILVFFVIIARISMPLRAWWYQRVNKGQTPPPEVRRYLMRSGIRMLKRVKKLPPETQEQVATQMLAAALDDKDGVFEGMHDEMIADAMAFLGTLPLEHCATCKRPIFTYKATIIGDMYYCENCGQAQRPEQPQS
jgi:hypothetical protein